MTFKEGFTSLKGLRTPGRLARFEFIDRINENKRRPVRQSEGNWIHQLELPVSVISCQCGKAQNGFTEILSITLTQRAPSFRKPKIYDFSESPCRSVSLWSFKFLRDLPLPSAAFICNPVRAGGRSHVAIDLLAHQYRDDFPILKQQVTG